MEKGECCKNERGWGAGVGGTRLMKVELPLSARMNKDKEDRVRARAIHGCLVK